MPSSRRTLQILAAVAGIALVWSYFPVLTGVVERWYDDPKYSHSYFVPVFALWLLWRRVRQSAVPSETPNGSGSPVGLPVLSAAIALHTAGEYFFLDWFSEVSFLVALAALCLGMGGWRLLRLAGPSIGFLAFMLPLPFQVEVMLALPLQRLATVASTYLLQLIGLAASSEGNVIVLNEGPINVVDACSGLGMLVTFFALTTGVAIVLRRPLLDKLVVVASAIPIALLSNVLRIVVTGVLFENLGKRVAMVVYHDLAGLLIMMPFALLLIGLELMVLSRLLVQPAPDAPEAIGLQLGGVAVGGTPRTRRKNGPVGV